MSKLLRNFIACCLLFLGSGYSLLYGQCAGLTLSAVPSQFVYCGIPANVVLNNTSSGGNAGTTTYEYYRDGVLFQTVIGTASVNDALGSAGTFTYTIIGITATSCRDTIAFSIQTVIAPVPSFTYTPASPCPGATVTFTNTSSGIIGTTTWLWDFGDASPTSNVMNPTHVYAANGPYTVSLTQTNVAGCAVTTTQTITIVPPPVASFTFAPNNQCPYTPITFTNTSTGVLPGATYAWNFGNGGTSTAVSPTYAYGYPGGTFNVTLTITNPGGCVSNVATLPITVLPSPNVVISGDDGDGDTFWCLTFMDTNTVAPVIFTNTTTGATNFSWDYGDGSPVFNTLLTGSHTHNFGSYGTFNVVFTAFSANGCISRDTIVVVFENTISGSFSIPPAQFQGCIPHTICPINNSINANSWTWNFGDGSPPITTTNPVPPCHLYTVGGVYTITLISQNSCYTQTSTVQTGTLGGPPTINFNPTPNPGCSPQLVTMNNTTTGASPVTNYFWNFGRGPADTLRGIRNPPPQLYYQGTYIIMLISGNACGRDTVFRTIVVDSIPVLNITVAPTNGCTPLTVISTNNSSGNAVTHAWYIDGGICCIPSPNYTTYTIPPQVFTAPPGTNSVVHTIRYVISNHCGTRDTTVSIRVHPTVVANFNMSTTTFCAGGSVTFTNTSLGDSLSWTWDFDNGNTANTAGPHTQTYNTPGTYDISLIVNGECGIDTIVRQLIVRPFPVVSFTPNPAGGCVPLVVNFTNSSTVGGTFSWNFGPGSSPGTFNGITPPAVTFSSTGSIPVTLTENLNGCIASATVNIQVDVRPIPAFTATPASGCTPLTVTFVNNTASVGTETWFWDFGDGTNTNVQHPGSHVFVNPGTTNLIRNVKLVVTNATGCKDSLSIPITIYPLPVAGFTNAPEVCENTNAIFTNTSTGATSYNWNFGDGQTSTAANPAHNYNTLGAHTVTLISITNFGCRDTIIGTVFIDSVPNAAFVADTVCIGESTTFTNLSTGAPTTWLWTFGDGNTSGAANPTHTYFPAGTYNVELLATNVEGCKDSVTIAVPVRPVPTANFTAPPACFTSNSIFTNTSTGSPTSSVWNFGDGGSAFTTNATHVYGTADTFTVTLIVMTGLGCSDTISIDHIVNPIPTPSFVADTVCHLDTTSLASTSGGMPNTFTWLFGDGNSDATNQNALTHYYSNPGTYTVSLIAGYASTGCRDTIQQPVIVRPTPVAAFTTNTACVNDTTFLIDGSSASPTLWTWNFNDASANSALQNPPHVFPSAGTYNVMLVAENIFGCLDTLFQNVVVNPRPVADFNADTVCLNLSTTFLDASVNSVSWNWDFGDGSPFDISQNPGHIFPNDGTYNVTQIVWNALGCTDTIIQTIVVNPLPVSDFSFTTSCFGYNTAFTDLSTNAVSWNWDFGDTSGTSNVASPLYLYGNDGVFNATLIVNNIFGCADTLTQPVTVLPIPVAGFSYPVVCAGVPVQFTDTTLNSPNAWSWDFGDGSGLDVNQNPIHTYNPGNIYTVTFIAGNSVGCFDTLVSSITVNTVPVPEFTADTVCMGLPTSFVNLSTDPNTMNYVWDFGDGNNSYTTSPQYIFGDSGTQAVQLTSINNWGCMDSITHLVYVPPVPVADFIADSVCTGTASSFTNTSSSYATNFAWDFGDGGTSTQQNPSHTFSTTGNQTVSLTVTTTFGCTQSITQNVVALDAPLAAFTQQAILCATHNVQFTNLSTNNPNQFDWSFGDGGTSTATNPGHIFSAPGTFDVMLIATNSIGCPDTSITTITVSENPVSAFEADTVCIGGATYFTNQSAGAGTLTWFWDFGNNNNTSFNQNPGYIFFDSAGIYQVTLIVTNTAGCADTTTNPVWLTPLPIASFTSNPAMPTNLTPDNGLVNFANTSVNSTSWFWTFGDGNNSSQQHPAHDYTTTGEFCVTLVAWSPGGCADTTISCAFSVLQGTPIIPNTFTPNSDNTNDVFEIPNIELFPNNKLIIYNRWGNLVYEKEHYHNEWDGTNYKNGERLPDGAYFYVFTPGDGQADLVGDVVIFR
jgi:gliding motility-associated-like protein